MHDACQILYRMQSAMALGGLVTVYGRSLQRNSGHGDQFREVAPTSEIRLGEATAQNSTLTPTQGALQLQLLCVCVLLL